MKLTSQVFFCALLLLTSSLFAQVNEKGFSFQGYARDLGGNAIGGKNVFVKFSIYESGNSSSPDFVETHEVNTDAFGVFSATVGSVNNAVFYGLDWVGKNYLLKAEVSINGSDFVTISDTQLLSVPYAQAAGRSENGVPAGTILPFGGIASNIPEGFLLCDGQQYSQTTYPELYTAIGLAWGGSGNNFRVPDLRGYFLRGVDGGSTEDPDAASRVAKNGSNSGNSVGSYQDGSIASHKHNVDLTGNTESDGAHTHDIPKSKIGNTTEGETHILRTSNLDIPHSAETQATESAGAHTHSVSLSGDSDPFGGGETRPKNAYVHYIIKY